MAHFFRFSRYLSGYCRDVDGYIDGYIGGDVDGYASSRVIEAL